MDSKQLELFDKFNQPNNLLFSEVFPDTESDEVEYKSAKDGFPNSFWETYSAFGNTNGGVIVLGVKEKKNQLFVEGLDDATIEKYKKDFWNTANNRQKASVNLLRNEDVREYLLEDKKVLAFRVSPALRTQKPVFLNGNPLGNTYKRNYEGDYKCTDEEVRRMLADADLSVRPDSRILEGYTMDDFDAESIKQYRQLFASNQPTHNWLALDDKQLLTMLGGYRIDRKTKNEGPTLAGILMFGKSLSITDPECCPQFFPDYRELLSDDPAERWSDRIIPDGTWEANLFQFFRKVWPKLSNRLPKPFKLSKGVRLDETLAHTALREAFVNALIHTDYSAPGNIIIASKPNIFSFSNPGTLLVTLEQYYTGGISECRNTSLQKMFLMIGSAEKAGSGVGKILSGWSASHWRTPFLNVETNPDRLILELPMFSILPEETLLDLKGLFGDKVEKLDKDKLTILAVCHIEGEVSNRSLQYMISKHRTDITKMLQDLTKEGYLISDNKSRWTTYHLNTEFAKDLPVDISKHDSSPANLDSSSTNLDSSPTNVDSSSANLDSSDGNLDTSEQKKEQIRRISKKLSKEQLQALIMSICKDDFISAEEIADATERKIPYLRNEIIPKMIEEDKLERLYPDNPHHPNQKYKTKK